MTLKLSPKTRPSLLVDYLQQLPVKVEQLDTCRASHLLVQNHRLLPQPENQAEWNWTVP